MDTKEIMREIMSMDTIELRRYQLLLDGEIERRKIENIAPKLQDAAIETLSKITPTPGGRNKKLKPITDIKKAIPIIDPPTMIEKEQQHILNIMTKDREPLSVIVERAKLPYKIVYKGIKSLQKAGKVICDGTGRGTRFRIAQ